MSVFMLKPRKKQNVIKSFKVHDSDTGSADVQIALLTESITELTKHLKDHKKDFSSRRGLIKKVSERRRLLKYLEREDKKAWKDVKDELGLK